jgi:uncharacterized protein
MTDDITTAIDVLRSSTNIAVVGLSRYPGKAAHDIPALLSRKEYNVVGVNPHADGPTDGMDMYDSLLAVPFEIDVVNVFRPSHATDKVIEEAIERHHIEGDVSCIWLQEGITSKNGSRSCADEGITYLEDLCIYVVYQYLRV